MTSPSPPLLTSWISSPKDGKNRLSVPTPSTTPALRQASIARSALAFRKVSGFSQNTPFPLPRPPGSADSAVSAGSPTRPPRWPDRRAPVRDRRRAGAHALPHNREAFRDRGLPHG